MRFPNRGETGFTLTELLVVIVILGVLAAVAIPIFLSQSDNASDAALKSELASVARLLQAAEASGETLPSQFTAGELVTLGSAGSFTASQTLTVTGSGETLCVEGVSQSGDVYSADLDAGVRNYDCAGYEGGWKPIQATGGDDVYDVTEDGVTYRVHEYTTVGGSAFTVTDLGSTGEIEYLVVGGGGGGSAGYAGNGGGGAGGYVPGNLTLIEPVSLAVQVGAGGTGGNRAIGSSVGTNGASSILGDITAYGGGAGGVGSGIAGASSGGAGYVGYVYRARTLSAHPEQGNAGGANLCSNEGGGGGGAGGPGTPSTYSAFSRTYTDPNGDTQTVSVPAGPTAIDATSCLNPYYDNQYRRTTIDSPETPVHIFGFATGPAGKGGPGIVNGITGAEIEYARGGDARSSAAIPANTGSGAHSVYALSPAQAMSGADGTVIIRYPLTTPA